MKKSVLFIIASIVFAVTNTLIYNHYMDRVDDFLMIVNDRNVVSYEKVTQTYVVPAKLLVNTLFSTDEITQILYKANNTSDAEYLHKLHNRLFDLTDPIYQKLILSQYRQLHFHLKDNRSFLRLHRPEKFNDNLTGFRATVSEVNRTQKPIVGFEEGRIFNGFRYVFPLFYNDEHVGSVEVSLSVQAIINVMESGTKTRYDFVLLKDVVDSKVFNEEMSNYRESHMHPDFYIDLNIPQKDTVKVSNATIGNFEQHIKNSKKFQTFLKERKSGTELYWHESNTIAITFMPLLNFEQKHVGYIIGFEEERHIPELFKAFILLLIGNSSIIILTTALILILIRSRDETLAHNQFQQRKKEEIEELNQNLEQRNLELKQANQTKDRFFSIISHDLRNPIAAMVSVSDYTYDYVQEKNYPDNELKDCVMHLQMGAKRSQELLENLLHWSRTQQQTMSFSPQMIEPYRIAEKVKDELHLIAITKNVRLLNQIPSTIQLFADEEMLKLMLRNLISNSLKFSRSDQSISVLYQENNGFQQLIVQDNGVGMKPTQLEKVLQKFEKESTNGTNEEQGTGLGLLLVQEFMDFHHGFVQIDSMHGKGTTVTLNFKKPND